MIKNKILEKLLVIVLVFTLTFANFAFVTKSYAVSFAEIFGIGADTGSRSVEFEAYFKTEDERESSVICDVNKKDLAISVDLNIKDNGYLKDAKIQVIEAEDGVGLNFDLKQSEELSEFVRNFENNTYYLNQIDKSSKVNIQIPIEYKNEEYVNENKISTDSLVVFSGIYVDNEGDEVEVLKEVLLNVSWKDERKVNIQEEATKYITYGDGVILQTIERVDNSSEENTLPVKETELEIIPPVLKDKKPTKVTVVANSTEATNGEEIGELSFDEKNWEYNEEENKLVIKVNNEKKLVEVKENEDEFLQDVEKEILHEERYYNGSGVDEFLVTYTYSDLNVDTESIIVNSNVTAKMTTVSGVEKEDNINIVTNNQEYSYELTGATGNIVSLNIENKKEEISKSYTYVNYNNSGKYETEIQSEMVVNISYKDIVEKIEILDKETNYIGKDATVIIPTNDIYYKTISISKENFDSILGENGEIKVKDELGNQINIINKDIQVNELGNMELGFEAKYSRLSFEISKPVGEGNLILSVNKAFGNASVDKTTFSNLDRFNTKTSITAKYDYVDETVDVAEIESNIKLIDTKTEANLVIDRDSLSTIEENTDVELKIELNNDKEVSDIYGHSEFEIELPENIENINVTNISLLYGEGLSITSNSVEGRIIKVVLDGVQEGINSGVLTNGTNIVINANIKLNLYTPAKSETIKLRYNNSEATNYTDSGNKEVSVKYSAPTGLVAVNSITGYNDEGNTITSVRQGKKDGILDIYSQSRTVTTELIVMNNQDNTVSDFVLLGRIPFIGVKDLVSKTNLETTLDSNIVNGINLDARNRVNFKVYYSENGEATKDLNNAENGWTETPSDMMKVKSYLIVPEDTSYVMESAEVLRFSYSYLIPENLAHNEYSYGTFGIYYKNNSELSNTNEISVADLVGLTTGVGPEISLNMIDNKTLVKENEEFELTTVIENVGENVAENVKVEIPIPAGTTYTRYSLDTEKGLVSLENGKFVVTFNNLEIGENIKITVYLIAKPLSATGEYQSTIQPIAYVSAKDLATVLNVTGEKIQIKFAEFYILEEGSYYSKVEKVGNEVYFRTTVINSSTEAKNNVVVTKVLPKEFSLVSCTEPYEYDENTRTITWNLGKLEKFDKVLLKTTVKVNELEENVGKLNVETSSMIKADGTDGYKSNTVITTIGKPVLTIIQTTDNVDTYLKEGDTVNYKFKIKNEGGITATNVKIVDDIPAGIVINKITYKVGDVELNKTGYYDDKVEVVMNIEAGQEWELNLQGKATSLGGAEEQSATNYAVVSSTEINETQSNSITHIIEASSEEQVVGESSNSSTHTSNKNQTTRTYKINGTAWVDSNEDGMRNSTEELLSGIVIRLVNSETGVIQQSTTTDARGGYVFSGVQNGNYIVLFEYDTATYKVAAYQKEGILANVNSDVISTTVQQDGESKLRAVTDVIKVENRSISNIDMGLVLANTFDLRIDKSVSKITVQTSKGTTSEIFNDVDLAKTEIASKYLSGATVYVEYSIKVTNDGDLAGYAKKIVDYIPTGMTFNSALDVNADWYTGLDGNLYTDALQNKELKSGESTTIRLVLTKQMTEENTGLSNNQAEIYEDYNTYGIKDINSTPANKAQGENDLSSADMIVSVKTGEVLVYISVIIVSIILGSIVIFMAHNKIVAAKRKGGV